MTAMTAVGDPAGVGPAPDVAELLAQLRSVSRAPTDADASRLVEATWSALGDVIADSSEATRGPLVHALAQLAAADARLGALTQTPFGTAALSPLCGTEHGPRPPEQRGARPLDQLRSALVRLDEAECSV